MSLVQAAKTPVILAGREFQAKAVPIARIKKIVPAVMALLQDVDFDGIGKDTEATEHIVGELFDKVLEAPHAILSVFIKDLPKDIFTDEDDGVTFPELFDALEKVLIHNRIGGLKNLVQRLPQWYPSLLSLIQEGNKTLAQSKKSS